ncbi:MAG: TraR/DksA C4-type zinc finger protein [Pirellulaceae bacterium]
MPAKPIRLLATCPHCNYEQRLDLAELVARLRSLGMLKRDELLAADFVLQLAAASRSRLFCAQCGSGGLRFEPAGDDDEWETPAKPCSACGSSIPIERLELFPESELCAACQQRIDRGQSPDRHDDFCPRCGTRMTVRQRRGSGIVGYEQVCPACRLSPR